MRPGTIPCTWECGAVAERPEPGLSAGGGFRADWVAVRLPAEIDIANAAAVCADLIAAADRGAAIVIADLTASSFCDCAGTRALIQAGRHAARRGAELRVAAAARPLLRMFDLTGVNATLRVCPSVAAAAIGPPAGGPGLSRRGTAPG
jgi:anti-anti-sigma factor